MSLIFLFNGIGEFTIDVTTGIVDLAWNAGQTIGSTIGYSGSYYAHELGLINDSTYNELSVEYMNNLTK